MLLEPLRAAPRRARCWPSRSARSIGPSGPPVSAISPSACSSSAPIVMCARSIVGGLEMRAARRASSGWRSRPRSSQAARSARRRRGAAARRARAARSAPACAPRNRRRACTPTIGWMPASASLSENSSAPKRLLVSVSPSAGKLVRRGELGELGDRQRAFEQRIGRMHLEVHELRGAGGRASAADGERTRSVHEPVLRPRAPQRPRATRPPIPGQAAL